MHALQFQIDNVKAENNKLKQKIVDLEQEQQEIKTMKQTPPQIVTAQPSVRDRVGSMPANPMNNARKNNFSKQSSMDIDNDMNANAMRNGNVQNMRQQKMSSHSQNKYGFNRQNNANNDRFGSGNNNQEQNDRYNAPNNSNNDRFGSG